MPWKVLIAHAVGEESLAEKLAEPIREAGYEVAHRGTVMVGDSVTAEASKILSEGGPVVLCGTIKAMGTKWARVVVNAARQHKGVRIFIVQMEEEADVEIVAFDELIARHWQDAEKAISDLIASLKKRYPLDADSKDHLRDYDIEHQYRELLLKSCDIINLAELPEQDRHIATRELELRRLYVSLRVNVEMTSDLEMKDSDLEVMEKRRIAARYKASMRDVSGKEMSPDAYERVPVGHRLRESRRLIVLGDPGAGKTTMIRWIATAYLLKLRDDPDWKELPDIETLPKEDLLPVIVRCRELDASALNGSLEDILSYTLRKAEMQDDEASLKALLKEKLKDGKAILLIDGLDEITDPALRVRFCRQLEQIHRANPMAMIIATSRIVGYKEMGYRVGRGFEHVTVAELSKEDKDEFARRWCKLTEPPERKEKATEELIRDIHSAERIERLTGNPMLLTTMALVKRKVGKLPSRRADLYSDAIDVLLNWRREVDEPIDRYEAIPQIEYIAYAMCDRGVQRLREDEIIQLFEQMRVEYPQLYAVEKHTANEFLHLLERRTGILVEAGHERHLSSLIPVFEFRHLTFQEYMAARALVDGCFPGREPSLCLAEYVAPLAGKTSKMKFALGEEDAVTEDWREALRLCVTCCKNDDVDSVLQAILNPMKDEDAAITARPRAVMATLCLADEPNASEDVARVILRQFVQQIGEKDGFGNVRTSVDAAAIELASSRWSDMLRAVLVEEFCNRDSKVRPSFGALCGMVAKTSMEQSDVSLSDWFIEQTSRIVSGKKEAAIDACLSVMIMAYSRKIYIVSGLIGGLMEMLIKSAPESHAACWALRWLNNGSPRKEAWIPSAGELDALISFVADDEFDIEAVRYPIMILGRERCSKAVEPLITRLEDKDDEVRKEAAKALGLIKSEKAIEPLIARLYDKDISVRQVALNGVLWTCDDEIDRELLSRGVYTIGTMLDPQDEIPEARVQYVAKFLELTVEDVRRRYEALARRFKLKLSWIDNAKPDGK